LAKAFPKICYSGGLMALFNVAQLQAQLQPLYNDFAYQYADELQALAGANMVYATKADKRTRNTGDKLRRITGALFKSLRRNDANNIFDIKTSAFGFDVIYGSALPYAAIHEYGGRAGKGLKVNIPKRPYLLPALEQFDKTTKEKFTNAVKYQITLEIMKWLEKQKR
jgi:phage gpG-like protein